GMLFSAFLYYTLQALVKNKSIIEREKKQLQDSEAKMHAIVDNTVDALITIDENGAIESFNIACEEMFGYSAQDVIGSNVKILMPEPYHAEHDGYLHNYHSTGRKKIIGIGREVQARRKNGDIFPIDLSVSEVTVQDRKIFSGIIRDITERKKSEEEILRSNTELERFAYVASHDLQEPLRMVTNFTGLLERQYGDKLDDTAKEYIRYAYDGGRRMQELVNDLLEYARLGQEAESVKSVNLNGLMILVKENLKESIDASGAVIDYDELPIVSATPVRLLRVMQNLIGNAMKYQAPDAKPHITISAKEDNGIWEIALRDNGIGMKPEYCEKIFEPFKRLHAKHEYSGTGMGLSICRKIIEGFDGTIWATSNEGDGSTFYFTIPASYEHDAYDETETETDT
ncbi:MAG: sensor histidine kinase, partial [Bdellovibrionales bacterium]